MKKIYKILTAVQFDNNYASLHMRQKLAALGAWYNTLGLTVLKLTWPGENMKLHKKFGTSPPSALGRTATCYFLVRASLIMKISKFAVAVDS